MELKKILGALGLNLGIIIVNIIVFSPGFIGLSLRSENVFVSALGITILIMSIFVFISGNYRLLVVQQLPIKVMEIENMADCVQALEQNKTKKTFNVQIQATLEQMNRLRKKQEVIHNILLEHFTPTEMSYAKFEGVLTEVEHLMFMNIKSMINRLNAFDEQEYMRLMKGNIKNIDSTLYNNKLKIYEEYTSFVKESVTDNEEILLKLDELLLELSKLDSFEEGEIENMPAMAELDTLISKTKFYKE